MTELPVAGYSPESPQPPVPDIAGIVADIAETIRPENPLGDVGVRVGVVTAVESSSPFRVKLDITGTGWLSRTADSRIAVGDRVWAVQQGEVFIIVGRLNSFDALTPIGGMIPFAGSSPPNGWLFANGATVSRTTEAALFAVCGTTYGAGDGSTTFNLPNMLDRIPVGSGFSYTRGATGGAATVTLSTTQIPSHNHSFGNSTDSQGSHSHGGSTGSTGHSHSVGNQTTRNDIQAAAGSTVASTGGGTTGSDSHTHSVSTDSQGSHSHSISGNTNNTGSGGSHENMQPYLAVPYIIRTR